MTVVIFDAKRQRLVTNCGGRFCTEEHAMSLRIRRLFYVAKFAAIAVVGPTVNGAYNKDVMRALVVATSRYEKTGVYEIPLERFNKGIAFAKGETSFIVMTKKGLYHVEEEGVRLLDDSETLTFGVLGGIFNVVYTKLQDVEKSLEMMRATSTFLSKENIECARRDCGDIIDLDSKDEFETSFRVDVK